jgi:2'-5' RNA ligase
MPSRRLFIAVDISDEVRRLAAEHIDMIRRHARDIRVSWEKPEKLHVTLKFLGNVDDQKAGAVRESAAAAAESFSPFRAAVSGTGVFPNAQRPRVLWLGIENADGALKALAARVDELLIPIGFEKEKRRFSPHLTIARVREPGNGKGLADAHLECRFDRIEWDVRELVIYQSELKTTGSVYRALARYPFGITDN